MMGRKIILKPEDQLHKEFCDYLQYQYRGVRIHHSPNEGKRSWFQRMLMTILRVSPGFPDLLLIYKHKCICIELKAVQIKYTKTNAMRLVSYKPTAEQLEWIQTLNECAIPSRVCVGIDEAMKFADEHFLILKQ